MRPFLPLLLTLLPLAPSPAGAAGPGALFVGNSYSFANDGVLADGFGALMAETTGETPEVQMVAKGGYTFSGHLADAGTPGEKLHDRLGSGASSWTVVVLQEQSQIPGFHEALVQDWFDSLSAAQGLDDLAEAAGAETLFLMTWGRREGDPANPELFPDFLAMQALLAGGYEKYALLTSTPERPVRLAPAGLAWQLVWEDAVAAGEDPLSPDSLFWRLYSPDGSHPSLLGSYLATLVVFAAATGSDPSATAWVPEGVATDDAESLRDVARRTVLGEPSAPLADVVTSPDASSVPESPELRNHSDLTVMPDQPGPEQPLDAAGTEDASSGTQTDAQGSSEAGAKPSSGGCSAALSHPPSPLTALVTALVSAMFLLLVGAVRPRSLRNARGGA